MAEGSSNFQLHADQAPLIINVSIAMAVVATISLCLRFFSRRVTHVPIRADDWFILASMPFALATAGIAIYGCIHHGLGTHVAATGSVESLEGFLQGLYVFEITYCTSIALSKFSIIALYWRIFASSSLRIPLNITAAATVAWVIAVDLVAIFSCDPVEAFWIFTIPAKCINSMEYFVWGASCNILIDAALLVLPLIMVSRLQITAIQKVGVSAVFMLGFFVTLCSCLRLNQLVIAEQHGMSTDPTWDLSGSGIWSVIEACASIVCACLPSMRPLARWIINGKLPQNGLAGNGPIGGLAYRPRSLASFRSDSFSTQTSKKRRRLIKSPSKSAESWETAKAQGIEKPALAWSNNNPFKSAVHVEDCELSTLTLPRTMPAASLRGWSRSGSRSDGRSACPISRHLQDLSKIGSMTTSNTSKDNHTSSRPSHELSNGEVWVQREFRVDSEPLVGGRHRPMKKSITTIETTARPLVTPSRPDSSDDGTSTLVGSDRVRGPYGEVRWPKKEEQEDDYEMGLGVVEDEHWFRDLDGDDLELTPPQWPKPRPISSMESLTLGRGI